MKKKKSKQALEAIKIRFLQNKYFKKFHACVPLRISVEGIANTRQDILN
jgi:hypothetical protein